MPLGARSLGAMAAGVFNMRGDSSKFLVVFDNSDYDLGSWSKVSGLTVNMKQCEYRHGADVNDIWNAPGIPTYQNIKLSRATCPDSQTVQEWLAETAANPKPFSGSIQLQSWIGVPLITWELDAFFPVGWSVADLDTKSATVVIETLELTHTGFLKEDDSLLGGIMP